MMSWSVLHRSAGPESGEISIQVGFEFVLQYQVFGITEFAVRLDVSRINQNRAAALENFQRRFGDLPCAGLKVKELPCHAEAHAT